MKSMTGYGYSEYRDGNYILTLEIKAYNNRYLDISFNSPALLSPFEQEVTERIKACVNRGHLDVSFRLKTLKTDCEVSVDDRTALSYIKAVKLVSDLCRQEGLETQAGVSEIISREGVINLIRNENADLYRGPVFGCLDEALHILNQAREREGLATKANLQAMIGTLASRLADVESHASSLEEQIKTGLRAKIQEMLGDLNYDENRILTEVAVMLMRYTVNEEVVRLRTHIAEFNRLLESGEPAGKKLDFLCQEMNREINTIGSKSQIVEMNLAVVDMKDCLENIREQIRNIE